MKSSSMILVLLAVFLAQPASALFTSKPIQDQLSVPVPPSPNGAARQTDEVQRLIMLGCQDLGWRPTVLGPQSIRAVLYIRAHIAEVDIPFSTSEFSITFSSANNLDYDPEDRTIHKSYNHWVANLRDSISRRFATGDIGPVQNATQASPQSRTISPQEVKVYFRPPDARFEELGLLEASSSRSWAFSSQGKMNKVMERLKAQAAKLGANGILLVGVGNEYAGSVNTASATATGYGNSAYASGFGTSVAVTHKAGTAIAIYVHPTSIPAASTATSNVARISRQSEVDRIAEGINADSQAERVGDVYEAIIKLDELRKRGLLTDDEFLREKQKILSDD